MNKFAYKFETWHIKGVTSTRVNEHIKFSQAKPLLVPSKGTNNIEKGSMQIKLKQNRKRG